MSKAHDLIGQKRVVGVVDIAGHRRPPSMDAEMWNTLVLCVNGAGSKSPGDRNYAYANWTGGRACFDRLVHMGLAEWAGPYHIEATPAGIAVGCGRSGIDYGALARDCWVSGGNYEPAHIRRIAEYGNHPGPIDAQRKR